MKRRTPLGVFTKPLNTIIISKKVEKRRPDSEIKILAE